MGQEPQARQLNSAGGAAEGSQGQAASRSAWKSPSKNNSRPEGAQHASRPWRSSYSLAPKPAFKRFGLAKALYAPSGRVVLLTPTQGRRAKRLPLATFCRTSGAR
ncbi:hypothetical protein BH18ACI4_BH18ACI4_18430 [soil metagenome]